MKNSRKYLEMYGTNLTEKARNQKVDRVIGRDKELDRVVQILNRRTKNNPILIGEPVWEKQLLQKG
jgi:ATP-dependent Clp protease ATP-binding subunit ClpC